jgi:ribosome-binding protein aMBF1 (putative translation factor)
VSRYHDQRDYGHRATRVGTGVPNPIVLGRKFCSRCGHWRHACDFAPRWRNTGSGLSSQCRACTRIMNRESYARRTPEQRDRANEYHRIWSEVQRRRAGKPARTANRPSVVDRPERILLDPAPLIAALRRYEYSQVELAARAGIRPRAIYRITHGESKHVRVDVADKLAVALGLPLEVIYG